MAKLTYGGLAWATPVETIISAGVPTKALGSTTASQLGDFTHSNNRLTYNGATTRDFGIMITCSFTKASGGSTLGTIHIAKNGSAIAGLQIDRTLPNSSDVGALSVCGSASLSTNDFIELFIHSDNGDNITITTGQICIKVLG